MPDFERLEVTVLELDLDTCANTFGVLPCTASGPAGSECYNTFQTCQDPANFNQATKTFRFSDRGAPIPLGQEIRPTIVSTRFATTKLDLERGLAPRGSVKIELQDEPDDDVGVDPYLSTRTPAQGTFWTRLLARNLHTADRFARLRRGYFTDGWDDVEFVDELYIIDSISGPDSKGRVTVALKDPVKLADRARVPEATAGKTFGDITAVATAIPLEAGQGADYPDSGFVRVGKEIIQYASKTGDTLNLASVAERAQFGTTAAAHSTGAGVQLCKAWVGVPVTSVLEELLTLAGIEAANIDSAGFAVEEATWLGASYNVTAVISSPTEISKLLAELLTLVRGFMWWSPVEQKMKFKVFAPAGPDDVVPVLTDAGHWVEGSVKITKKEDLRTTLRALYYDLADATDSLREPESFARGEVVILADKESANAYGKRRENVAFSRWWTDANTEGASAEVNRASAYYGDAPQEIEGTLDPKDQKLFAEGDQVDALLFGLADTGGAPKQTRCLVCCRTDRGGQIRVTLRTTNFNRRFGFIAPDSAGDYPADSQYAHIAPDSGVHSDGTEGSLIF